MVTPEELVVDWETKTQFFADMVPRTLEMWNKVLLERSTQLLDRGFHVQHEALSLFLDLVDRAFDALEKTMTPGRGAQGGPVGPAGR